MLGQEKRDDPSIVKNCYLKMKHKVLKVESAYLAPQWSSVEVWLYFIITLVNTRKNRTQMMRTQ